jgi:hypothetical protein
VDAGVRCEFGSRVNAIHFPSGDQAGW